MSAIFNIYKDLYLNSNKSSKKTIFSKSTTNNSYNKNSHFNLFKNISLIKPKSFMVQKKSKKKKLFQKMKIIIFFVNLNSLIHPKQKIKIIKQIIKEII